MKRILVFILPFLIAQFCAAQQTVLNPDFGKNGEIIVNFDNKNNSAYTAHTILISDSNSVLVGGYIDREYMLHKITATGRDDVNFGIRGFRFFDYGTTFNNRLEEIIKYPGGKSLLIGNISPAVSVMGKNTSLNGSAIIRLMPDGTPDTSFGVNGKVYVTGNFFNFWPSRGVVQPDGKIIIAARASRYDAAVVLDRLLLFRLNANGTLDNSFGTQGIFYIPQIALTPVAPSPVMGLALQADGKIILGDITAENTSVGTRNSAAVFRIKPEGVLDSSFAVNGRFLNRFGFNDYQIRSLLVQPDGKILVGGNTISNFPITASWLMFRLNQNGQVDSSFAVNGLFTRSIAGSRFSVVSAISMAENDRVMVAAFHDNTNTQGFIDVFKLKLNGTFDSTFAQNAVIFQQPFLPGHFFENLKMALDTAMNPTILGYSPFSSVSMGHMIVRLTRNGIPVTEFNGNGIETYISSQSNQNLADYNYGSNDRLVGATQFADGKILMAGNIFQEPNDERRRIGLVRMTRDGKIDSSFGTAGRKVAIPDNDLAITKTFLKLADDKIIMNRNGNTLFKIDSTGKIDSLFGTNGLLTLNLPTINGFPTEIRSLAQQADGKILVLSTNKIFRILSNGQPDNSFGVSGSITLLINNDAIGQKINIQQDGKIVAAIQDANGVQLFRCSASGVADNTFGGFNSGYTYVNVLLPFPGEIIFRNIFRDFEIQADGKIVLLCMKERFTGIPVSNNAEIIADGSNYRDIILYRTNANGIIDNTFGGIPNPSVYRGTSHLNLPFVEEIPGDLFIAPDGKIMIAGFLNRGTGWDVGLIQLKEGGLYDTTCLIKGLVTAGQDDVLQDRLYFGDNRTLDLRLLPLQNNSIMIAGTQLGQGADFFGYNFVGPSSPSVNYIRLDAVKDTSCFKVDISWTTDLECNVDSFYLEYSTDGISFVKIGSRKAVGNSVVATSYQFSHLNASYGNNYYRLRLFAGGVATSFVSTVKKVFIDNSPLGVITWQSTTQVRRGSVFDVQLSWKILNELRTNTLQLQISSDSINYQTIQTTNAGGTVSGIRNYSATVPNLNPGTYYFRILLSGDNCKSFYSAVKVVDLKACSGVLKVYPNPVKDILKVLIPECESGDLRVINAIGQTVMLIRDNPAGLAIDIDCRKLASGVYVLQYIGIKSSSVVKFEKL